MKVKTRNWKLNLCVLCGEEWKLEAEKLEGWQ
jgi:hypothetical protein